MLSKADGDGGDGDGGDGGDDADGDGGDGDGGDDADGDGCDGDGKAELLLLFSILLIKVTTVISKGVAARTCGVGTYPEGVNLL